MEENQRSVEDISLKFEKWAILYGLNTNKGGDGIYLSDVTAYAWIGWFACSLS